MRVDAGGAEQAEAGSLRCVLKVVRPRDTILVEQIKNRSGNWLVASWRRKNLVRSQVTKGSRGHEIGAVREGGSEDGGKVAVVDGEVLSEVVVQREIGLGVEPHGVVEVVGLLSRVIHAHEAVAAGVEKRIVGMKEVGFLVHGKPGVVEIGDS